MSGASTAQPKKLLGASFATAVAFSLLVALGVWQLRRLQWKDALIAQIDAAEHAAPASLQPGQTPPLFARVRAEGTLRGGSFALYGAEVRGMHMGAQMVEVLDRAGAAPLLVMLGWVATDKAALRGVGGAAAITGYVRLAEAPGWLSASDDLAGRHFYTMDPASIGAALGAGNAAPFILVALGQGAPAADAPVPAQALPRPPNNHLQYALTWFGLAGSLLAVFVGYALKR